MTGEDYGYDSSKPLEGVIAHLMHSCRGKNVEVTASSCLARNLQVSSVVELGTNSQFCSDDKPDSWVCFDFKERRLAPTSYSMRSHAGPIVGLRSLKRRKRGIVEGR